MKCPAPDSNVRDPRFWARWEQHRAAIRPAECSGATPCWVKTPYDAIARNGLRPRCTGCGGLIVPVKTGRHPPSFWPEPVAAILAGLEAGKR